jgi:hypothetical protein
MRGHKAIQVSRRREKERASHETTESGNLLPDARGLVRGSLRGEVVVGAGKAEDAVPVMEEKKGKGEVWQENTYWQ